MSSGNDLSGTIKTSFQSATTEAGALHSKVTQLTTATKAHNAEAIKTHEHTKAVREEFAKAKEEAHELAEKFHAVAGAGRLLGGPLGELVAHLGHMGKAGEENVAGLGRLAAVAGIAGLAFEALNQVMDARIEKLKMATENEEKYRDMVESANDANEKQASRGLGGEADRRKLMESGDPNALARAQDIALGAHIPIEEARKGVAASLRIADPAARNHALSAALELFKAGGSFSGGVEEIAGNRSLQAQLLGANGTELVAARLRSKDTTGSPYRDNSVESLHRAQDVVRDSEFQKQADRVTDLHSQAVLKREGRVAEGEASGDASKELIAAGNEFFPKMTEAFRKWSDAVDAANKEADAWGGLNPHANLRLRRLQENGPGAPVSESEPNTFRLPHGAFSRVRRAPRVSGEGD